MIPNEEAGVETAIESLRHIQGLQPPLDQFCFAVKLIRYDITHVAMRIVDYEFGRTYIESPVYGSIDLLCHQSTPTLIFDPAVWDSLNSVDNSGHALNITRDVDFHSTLLSVD